MSRDKKIILVLCVAWGFKLNTIVSTKMTDYRLLQLLASVELSTDTEGETRTETSRIEEQDKDSYRLE